MLKDGTYLVAAYATRIVPKSMLGITVLREEVDSDPWTKFKADLKGDTLTVAGFNYSLSELFRPERFLLPSFTVMRFIATNDLVTFTSLDMGDNTRF